MSHALLELYLLQGLYVPCPCGTLLQGLYVPCPCGTLFITGVICPMPMWNFIYYRGFHMGMGHIAPAINKVINVLHISIK
jgi:hypothetical protein